MDAVLRTGLASLVGVGGTLLLYVGALWLVGKTFPARMAQRVRPWIFVGPLLVVVTLMIVIPALRTVYLSLFDGRSESFIGLENFRWALTDDESLVVLRNNIAWVVIVASATMTMGMTVAVGSELSPRPRLVRSVVFMPMAISAVGASLIWSGVYAFKPASVPQVGILNQLIVILGGAPQAFFVNRPWNNLALMWIMIWAWSGFSTVIFAAALRSVPADHIEAAQIDGANGRHVFFSIILPHMRRTVVVVFVATVASVLKVFDIIRVSTNGQFETNVVANELINQAFRLRDTGRGSALAVILFLLIIPVMVFNAREFRRSER